MRELNKRKIMKIAIKVQFIGISLLSVLVVNNVFAQNLQISGGNNFSASLCSDGKIYAWGKNDAGQLGRNSSNVAYATANSSTPQLIYLPSANTLTMKQVDAGSGNTGIALACNGSVWTWGGNCGNGNIGNGSNGGSCSGSPTDGTNFFSALQQVKGGAQGGATLTNILYINASTSTSFAVENTGKVLAWGDNSTGALGYGTSNNTGNTYTPSYVLTAAATPLTNIKMVEGTDYGGYALANDGFVYSWGGDSNKDLGRTFSVAADQFYAKRVQMWDYTTNAPGGDLANIVKITGGDTHGLAIDVDGNLWSWGGDWGPGQRGWGATSTAVPYATKVVAPGTACVINQWKIGPWITDVVGISAGQQHSIALLADGSVVTFGNNSSGQLGIGSTASSGCPVYVQTSAGVNLGSIVSISDGDLWSFALTSSGSVYVWGENGNGELGIPGNTTDHTFATLNPAIPTACTGSLLPCPTASLGPDVLKCTGTSVTLLAGANGDTYIYNWYSGPSAAGPWTLIGAANRTYSAGVGATITVTNPMFYRVVITDTRAYVADKCGACVASEDIMEVADRTPPLATSAAGTCGTTVCFDINSTGAIDNTAFDWYSTQVSVPKLNSSGTIDPFCTAKTNLTLNGSNWEIWVDDKRTFQSTVGPTVDPCAPSGGTSGAKYQQEFVVYRDITLTEVDVYYKTYSVTAGLDNANVKVYSNNPNKNSSSNDGVNALTGATSTTFSFPRTSTSFTKFTVTGLNLPLTGSAGGTKYWLEISGLSNGEFGEFVCAGSGGYPYADAVVGEDLVILKGSTESAQVVQQTDFKALGTNWKFTYESGYPCGRFKLTAPNATVSCLPVEFLNFDGINKGKTNLLTWTTASEKNSNYFEVQRSADGINWITIGKVNAAGNSSFLQEYSFTDTDPGNGIVYYKIVETDFDGGTTHSSIISLTTTSAQITVKPNPNNGQFTLVSNGALGANTNISIYDAIGKLVHQATEDLSGKVSSVDFNLSSLGKGVYFIIINDGSSTVNQKLIVE
jgi:hypothetical protein